MRIMIKSEMDSRPLLYPLMRCLLNHGSILVITTSRYVARLIDNELEGGFRNIRIIVDEDGAVDDIYDEYGVAVGDYDYEILDNVGAVEYDLLLVPISSRVSDTFRMDIEPVLDLPSTVIMHLGVKPKTESKKSSASKKKVEVAADDSSYDPTSKWRRKTEEEVIIEKLSGDGQWSPLPSLQDIETLEASRIFYTVDRTLASQIYKALTGYLNIEERIFIKEVTMKDEGSSYISGTNLG